MIYPNINITNLFNRYSVAGYKISDYPILRLKANINSI